jgi:hypothetical protein
MLGVLKKNDGYGKNSTCKDLYKMGFVQGSQKLNTGSGKTIHFGTIDQGFTVYVYRITFVT